MVVERSDRFCLLCGRNFIGRTFLCRDCSDRWRDQPVPLHIRQRFYEELDTAYSERSNTYGVYNRPEALLAAMERLPRQVSIFEPGAGGGFLARDLLDMGFTDLTVSDITNTTAQELARRVPEADILIADAARLPFRDETFDVVVSSDLIEHLPDAGSHIAEVRRVLKPGGLYFLKTPNRLVAEAYYRLRDLHDAYFWHPSMFSPRELRDAFARHGFDVRFLRPARLTGAQLAKLPGPKSLRGIAGRLPMGSIPVSMRPHLETVARKRGDRV